MKLVSRAASIPKTTTTSESNGSDVANVKDQSSSSPSSSPSSRSSGSTRSCFESFVSLRLATICLIGGIALVVLLIQSLLTSHMSDTKMTAVTTTNTNSSTHRFSTTTRKGPSSIVNNDGKRHDDDEDDDDRNDKKEDDDVEPRYAKRQLTDYHDLCIVGGGLSGSIIAERYANVRGQTSLILERRPHIGGNCYDYIDEETGIRVSKYGAHLFHTKYDRVWEYVQLWSEWRKFELRVEAFVNGMHVPVPVNIDTVNALFNLSMETSEEMDDWLRRHQVKPAHGGEPRDSEEMAKSRVGERLYELIFRPYTVKQWEKEPRELAPSVLARIPVCNGHDDRYFYDAHQALPVNGYTSIFENMITLNPLVTVRLETDFFDVRQKLKCGRIYYTGPIDRYFADLGWDKLEYRSLTFKRRVVKNVDLFQPRGIVTHPNASLPYTRIVEYKHFFTETPSNDTVVFYEYSSDDGEPYYPVPNPANQALFERYKEMAQREHGVVFVGRLANYKYFNMDQTILNALEMFDRDSGTFHVVVEVSCQAKADDPLVREIGAFLRTTPVVNATYFYSAEACDEDDDGTKKKKRRRKEGGDDNDRHRAVASLMDVIDRRNLEADHRNEEAAQEEQRNDMIVAERLLLPASSSSSSSSRRDGLAFDAWAHHFARKDVTFGSQNVFLRVGGDTPTTTTATAEDITTRSSGGGGTTTPLDAKTLASSLTQIGKQQRSHIHNREDASMAAAAAASSSAKKKNNDEGDKDSEGRTADATTNNENAKKGSGLIFYDFCVLPFAVADGAAVDTAEEERRGGKRCSRDAHPTMGPHFYVTGEAIRRFVAHHPRELPSSPASSSSSSKTLRGRQ